MFEIHFKKLNDKWPRFYTESMKLQVFDHVQHVSPESLMFFISKAVWQKDPPRLEDFISLSYRSNNNTVAERIDCDLCAGTGHVQRFREGYSYALRCTCAAGDMAPKSFRHDGQTYQIRTFTEWDAEIISK
jgi:hypothetical protein